MPDDMRGVIVVDNGAGALKAGLAGAADPKTVAPNMVARSAGLSRVLVGSEVDALGHFFGISALRPADQGYVVNWDLQRDIWHHTFQQDLGLAPSEHGLLVTSPPFTPAVLAEQMIEIAMEDLRFQRFLCRPAPQLAAHRFGAGPGGAGAGAGVVVDVGFSFTHVVPFFEGKPLHQGIRRLDVGGKLLTNLLKEEVSHHSVNVMEETYVVEAMKKELCFVSQDPGRELDAAAARKSPYRLEYVLPDGVHVERGYVKPREEAGRAEPSQVHLPPGKRVKQQVALVNQERFMVPEALFHPSNVGLAQAGVAECVQQALEACPDVLQAALASNVVVVGGTTKLPGFLPRLERELRPLLPDDVEPAVVAPADPEGYAWRGGSALGAGPEYAKLSFSQADYQEEGAARLQAHVTGA